jgi:hypothetical protein
METEQIGNIRLINQQILEPKFKTPKDIVGWMGAMQAQDYNMAKWALGVRLPGSTEQVIQSAIDKGEILRTHLLRPTWHFVSADDIHWMLELSAPQIKALFKSRHRNLELSAAVLKKSDVILEKALSAGKHLTREELVSQLKGSKIATDDNRAAHLLMNAELDGLICSGTSENNKTTYALLEERVPKPKSLSREEALGRLADRYFLSHGPATLRDFSWWSGLSLTDARKGLESVKSKFISETNGSDTYWLGETNSLAANKTQSVFLLPAFDEFIISYKNRSASLLLENHGKAISNNGIFWPVVVVNGKVVGLWKRVIKKERVLIELDFFQRHNKSIQQQIKKAAAVYGNFLQKEPEVIFKSETGRS